MQSTSIKRRDFLRLTGLTGAGFVMGLSLKGGNGKAGVVNFAMPGDAMAYELSPFVIIDPSNKITIFNSKPEIGQGVYQSIPSLIAEELEVSLDQVTIQQTGGEKKYGPMQFAGGSFSVRSSYNDLRKVGAACKEMLVSAAAKRWVSATADCYAEGGKVFHRPTGRSFTYGELAETASKLDVPKEPKLKDPKDFKILGKSVRKPDTPLKSSGQAKFGIDVAVPGMLYASVQHCPVFGAKMISFDSKVAQDMKGVMGIETCSRKFGPYTMEGVAVVADSYWNAFQARKALVIKWDLQGKDSFNSVAYAQKLRNLAKSNGVVDKEVGDFDKTFASATFKVEAFYETPIVSHSPIEPMNCVANWTAADKVEIWASTQVPSGVRDDVAKEFNIPADNVKVNVMFNGGGFGRRLYNDVILETVELAKKVGKPLKVLWTREDDTQLGPFRPMTFSAMKGAVSYGKAIAFQHKVIAPTIEYDPKYDKTKTDGTMTEGISTQQYEIPNMKNLFVLADFHVPVAAWRAVTSTTLAFAHECFIDELAVKAKRDPMQFRLDMLTKDSDTKNLLLKLKEASDWDKPLPAGHGRGVAQYEFFAGLGGYVIEVSKKGTGIKIERITAVIDLGTVVNPDTVRAQVEGAAVMALGAATKGGITFDKGKTVQTNYHNNPLIRIHEMPKVDVHILANGGPTIKGVGEPGLPPFAPALCNAIYAATGKRIRKLPFDINKV